MDTSSDVDHVMLFTKTFVGSTWRPWCSASTCCFWAGADEAFLDEYEEGAGGGYIYITTD
jgi:hypothetical protein